jgi:3-hydroxybutyryl-CoA dehydrogenase
VSAVADFRPEVHVVAVIGAGQAGRSFAMACAAAGFYVVLEDVMPAKLRKAEEEYSDLSMRGGFGELQLASTVEEAVREADIAVDFVPDELESKLEIFSMIDRMAPPKTIICTPTDVQSITDLASCIYRPDRAVAVRGKLQKGETVSVLYPPAGEQPMIDAVTAFLHRLGIFFLTEADPAMPVLVKNQRMPLPN